MNTQTDWITALVILAAGLVLGLLLMYFSKRRNARTPIGDDYLQRVDLEARRDELIHQLRDPALVSDERLQLEIETAQVLRKLDAVARDPRKLSVSPATKSFLAPATQGFVWGATTFAILGGIAFFVMDQAAPRVQADPSSSEQAQQQPSPKRAEDPLQHLEAKVRSDPTNLQLRNDLAQALLERDNLVAVFQHTKIVLDQSPEDSRALTLQAVVRAAMGDAELAVKMLQRAARNDPKNLDARIALAWVYAQSNRLPAGEETIATALKEFPAEKVMLDQVLQQMKTHVARKT